MAVLTSRALICCSNAAARRDVEEKTWSSDLGKVVGKGILRKMGDGTTLSWLWWRVIRCLGEWVKEEHEEWERTWERKREVEMKEWQV